MEDECTKWGVKGRVTGERKMVGEICAQQGLGQKERRGYRDNV